MKLASNMKSIFSGRVVGLGLGKQAFAGGGLVAILCMQALAGPEGERVVNGSAQFTRNGLNTVIHASNNTIIDYRSFDIRANESVQFVQPSATSRVLNRVPDAVNPTRIDGSLSANGIVYIVNSAGVYFGGQSVVNAAGLYAAAGQITNSDFINNVNHFTNMSGTVSNAGTLNAKAVALVGKQVENLGTINAERGLVTMAAGDDVYIGEVGGTFMVQVASSGEMVNGTGVDNSGTINASGGTVRLAAGDMYSLALKMPGRMTARNVKMEAHGNGTAIVSGKIDATGSRPGETGGRVEILGDRVGIAGATIDASGHSGGGTILIGGDFQGGGGVRTSSKTTVTTESVLKADATDRGDGGKVIVWSDGDTRFYGDISAKGGRNGGDGGLAEVSGKRNLDFYGNVNISAASGKDGTLLLDPDNIVIQAAAGAEDGELGPADGDILFTDGTGTFTIGRAALEAVLGNIVLQANVDITVSTALDLVNQTTGESVTFRAGNDIIIDGDITTNGASINFFANDDTAGTASGSGNIILNNALSTAGGADGDINLTVAGGTGTVRVGANLQTDSGSISITGPIVLTAGGLRFDTEVGDDDAAGHIDLRNAPLSADAFGYDFTLDTSSANDAAGNVFLGTVNGVGGGFINDFQVLAVAATNSIVELNGDVLLDTNLADLSSFEVQSGYLVIASSLTIDTEQGNDGNAGDVLWGGTLITSSAFGNDLTIDASTTTGNGGRIQLGEVGDFVTSAFLNDLTIILGGASANSTLVLQGDIRLDANGVDTADVTISGADISIGTIALTLIDTEQGNDGNGGDINFSGSTLSAAIAGRDLRLDTGSTNGGAAGGDVTLGDVDATTGEFLNTLTIDTTASSAGRVNLGGDISLDSTVTDVSGLAVVGGGDIVLLSSVTIDTAQTSEDGGDVNFGTSTISATAAGRDLVINTLTSGDNGGAVTLGGLNNEAGAFLNDLTINTSGSVFTGDVTLGGNVSLDNNAGDTGDLSITAGNIIIAANNFAIDTEQGDDGNGGAVLITGQIVGNAAGRDLTINTSSSLNGAGGGAVEIDAIGRIGAGPSINNVVINTSGGSGGASGQLNLGGDIRLDHDGATAGSFTVVGAPEIVLSSNVTIDTEQGDNASAGAIDLGTAQISADAPGRSLTLNTSTAAGGASGGNITLGLFYGGGGDFVTNLTISRSGAAGNGVVTLNNNISIDGNFEVVDAGNVAINASTITIDTEQGNNGNAGDIRLGPATLATGVAGRDLILDASTLNGVGGDVLLPAIGNAGGAFLNDLTIQAGGSVSGGAVTLPTSISLNGFADTPDFTIGGASVIVLVGDTVIDTDVTGGVNNAGNVSFPVTATINGAHSLTIDTSADGGGNAGTISLLSTIGNTTRLTNISLTGSAIDLGATRVTGDITLVSDDIDFTGGADSVTSNGVNGTLSISPTTASTSIRVGASGAGTLVLDTTDVNAIGAFSSVLIGRADGTALINIGAATFDNRTVFQSGGVGGAINIVLGSAVATNNNASLEFRAGSGNAGLFSTATGASINTGSGDIVIVADSIDLQGGANTITTTGEIQLNTTTAGRNVVIGAAGAAGDFAIDDAEVAAFTDGAAGISFGDATATNTVTISEVTFNDPLSVLVPGTGGQITIDGTLTGAGDASITLEASGSTIFLNGDIVTTDNSDITLNDNVVVSGNRTLSTSGPGTGGDITINGTVNAATAGADSLTADSEDGDVSILGAIGATARLAALSIDAFGTATFGGDILVTGGGDVNFNTTPDIVFAGNTQIDTDDLGGSSDGGRILFDPASSINLSGPGSLVLAATADGGATHGDITLGSVGDSGVNLPTLFTVSGNLVTLNGDITTAGLTRIGVVNGVVVLAADVVIDNTAGSDASLTVNNVSGNFGLTLTGDADSQLSLRNVDVDSLTLTGGNLLLSGPIETDTAQDYTNVGAIILGADTVLFARDSDNAGASQNITTDADNVIIGAFDLNVTGNNISLAAVGDGTADPLSLTVEGDGDVTFGTVSVGSATVSADFDGNGTGTFTISGGGSLTVAANDLVISAADVVLNGAINAGASNVRISRSADGSIGVGDAAGDMALSKAELAGITGLSLVIGGSSHNVDIAVDNVAEADLAGIAGQITLNAAGNGGSITFQNAASTFRNLTAVADDGIAVTVDLTTTDALTLDADVDNAADSSDSLVITAGRTLTSGDAITLDATTGGIVGSGGISLRAANGVFINDSFATGGLLTVNSDTDADGAGVTTIATGAAVNTANEDISITASDLVLDGSIAAGGGVISIARSSLGAIRIAGTPQTGELAISAAELQAMTASTLNIGGSTTDLIVVEGVSASDTAGITGSTQLNAIADSGVVRFITGSTTFTSLSVNADNGIVVEQDLSTTTGDLVLNANSDLNDDDNDIVTVAGGVTIASGNDLVMVGNAVSLTGADGTTNTFSSAADGNITTAGIVANANVNVTINSENNVTMGITQVNAGTVNVTIDSDGDGVATLESAGISGGEINISGGPDNNDIIGINLDVTGNSHVNIRNAETVRIAGGVTIRSTGGDVNINDSIGGILLDGASDSLVNVTTGSGFIRLAPVTATNNADLTITSEGGSVLSSIDLNDGDLVVDSIVAAAPTSEINFDAGSITLHNNISTTGTDIVLDGPVILAGNVMLDTGAGPGDILFLSSVRSDAVATPRNLTLNAGTGNISATGTIGNSDLGVIDQLLIQSVNNATFTSEILANSIRQVAGTGTTTFDSTIIASGAGGIDLDGNSFVFKSGVVTLASGAGISITNTGLADFQSTATIAPAGAFLQDGTGAVTLAASITTALAPITFAGPVTIPVNITISNNGGGDITFGSTLTTNAPVLIDGGALGTGNINFNGGVTSTGELNVRTGTGSITFTNSATANSALTAATTTGAITFNGPLSVNGALSASSTSGVISFVSTVTAGSVFSASSQSGNIQFGGAVNGSAAGNGIFSINSGTGDVIFNTGANVGSGTAIQRFSATGRNITVQAIRTQGTTASGDGDISLTPDLTVTKNTVTEFPGQVETDNRPNGILTIRGDIVANDGDITIGGAGRTDIPSVATTIIGDINFSGSTLPTFTIAANRGNLTFGANEKITTFGNLSMVGVNVRFTDVAVLGFFSVNAGNTITLQQRAGALLVRPGADGTGFIRNQIDFGSNIVAGSGIGFSAPNVVTTGTGGAPSFASGTGVGTGIPAQFPVAIRASFGPGDLRSSGVALAIDARGTTDTGLATALASAIPRDTNLGTVTETSGLGQADRDQLLELRINPRDLSEAEQLDFLSGRSLYEDVVLDPGASPDDYLVAVNRLPSAQVAAVLQTYREVFKKPRIDTDTGEQATDPNTGAPLFEDRDREIREDLAAALRRFRKEGREGTLDPVEFRRYLENTPEESAALEQIESLQRFFQQLHLLGLGPKEEDNSRRTLLGRVCPPGLRVQQLEEVVMTEAPADEILQ